MDLDVEEVLSRCGALLFDCDGTLVNTSGLHYRAFNKAFESVGIELSRAWYEERVGLDCRAIVSDALAARYQDLDVDGIAQDVESFYLSLATRVEVFPAVAALVYGYAGRFPMAVVSNGNRAGVEASLQVVDLLPCFDAVVCADDGLPLKPAPDMYTHAARLLYVPIACCAVFEDSAEGIFAGQRAGARVIDVNMWKDDQSATAFAQPSYK